MLFDWDLAAWAHRVFWISFMSPRVFGRSEHHANRKIADSNSRLCHRPRFGGTAFGAFHPLAPALRALGSPLLPSVMPAHWVLAAWANRRELQENLQQAGTQLDLLRESAEEAQLAVHAAILAAENARTTLEEAEAAQQRLHEQLSSLPLVFDPEVVAALPVEMIQAIFRELAFEHDPLWAELHKGRYNRMRAAVPWRLAAVCRKWRRVAFDMPELWTYIAIPTVTQGNPAPELGEKLVTRMKVLLERSVTRPLDILVVCDDSKCHLKDLGWFQAVLNTVAQCASRWRRMHLTLPVDVGEWDLVFLRQPTPLLEEISVSVCTDNVVPWTERYPAYLTSCPSLRTLWMSAVFTPPQSPLNLLSCAHLAVDGGCRSRLWPALCQMQMLERLSIEFSPAETAPPMQTPPTPHLRLGMLQCLELYGFFTQVETWTTALEMPRLRKLVLGAPSIGEINRLSTFFSVACAGIVDFQLNSYGNSLVISGAAPGMSRFRAFAQLERVTFSDCIFPADVLNQLNQPVSQPIWPRLQSLTFDRPDPGSWVKNFYPDLCGFVGFRVLTRHHNNGGHAPLKVSVTGIDLEGRDADAGFEPWHRVLGYTLGPQNCHFTTSTGETLSAAAAVDTDSEESEDEASFTESDSDGSRKESDTGELESDPIETDDSDDDSEAEQSLIVSGPNWDDDQSDDSDYVFSDETDSENDSESEDDTGSDDAASP
ncbi:hypothetical protein AURDEDRAFT_150113 [Auricularia subglabra TFB-10046 SS5]|nr:hypothetical protein AURDEDRAFT_150113 [Auricularia subglabra TFB-10046 SS5]